MKEPWIYVVNQTIQLPSSNVVMKKNPSSVFNPVIVNQNIGINNTSKPFHVFKSSENINITIDSLQFNEVSILRHDTRTAAKCNVVIANSSCILSKYKSVMITASLSRLASCSVILNNSSFTSNGTVALHVTMAYRASVQVSINSCQFSNTTIHLMSQSSRFPGNIPMLRIDWSTFKRCIDSLVKVYGSLRNMVVTNSVFHDNKSRRRWRSPYMFVIISRSRRDRRLNRRIHRMYRFNILNSTFLRNTFRSIASIRQTSYVELDHVTVIANTFSLILSTYFSSSVKIRNIDTLNNTIRVYGLYIQHSTGIRLSKLVWKNNQFGRAVIKVFASRSMTFLTDLYMERNRVYAAIVFQHASLSLSRVTTSRNVAAKALFYFNGFTVNGTSVFGEKDVCKEHYLKSIRVISLTVNNFYLKDVKSGGAAVYHRTKRYRYSKSRFYNMEFRNVTGKKLISLKDTYNARFNELKINESNVEDAFFCKYSLKIEIFNATVTGTVSKQYIFSHQRSDGHYRNIQFFNNTVGNHMIYSDDSRVQTIHNFSAFGNVVDGNLLMGHRTKIVLRHIHIYNNTYRAGISMMSSVVDINHLFMHDNTGKKELFLGDFYLLVEKRQCSNWNDRKTMIISNTTINVTLSKPNNTQHSPVAFAMSVPDVIMRNVTVNLHGYQRTAFEMYINQRTGGQFDADLVINCPKGSSAKSSSNDTMKSTAFKYEVDCEPCRRNMYSDDRGTIRILGVLRKADSYREKIYGVSELLQIDESSTSSVQCLKCTLGGDCNQGKATSVGNFYSYSTSPGRKNYVYCPTDYCCQNTTVCSDFAKCRSHREGVLCGKCKDEYQENFFNTDCLLRYNCTNPAKFWVIFVFLVFLLFLIVCFFDIIINYITANVIKLKNGLTVEEKETLCLDILQNVPQPNETVNSVAINTGNEIIQDLPEEGHSTHGIRKVISEDSNTDGVQHAKSSNFDNDAPINIPEASIMPRKKENHSKNLCNDPDSCFTAPALFNVFVSYYQLRTLILVNGIYLPNRVSEFFNSIFNAEIPFHLDATTCPYTSLGAVDKMLIKLVMPAIVMLILLGIVQLTNTLFRYLEQVIKRTNPDVKKWSNIKSYLKECYSKILLFNYKNIAYFCFAAMHCVSMSDESSVLFINGNVKCYQSWQYIVMLFLAIWVIPFPIALHVANKLYGLQKITYRQSVLCLTFPIYTILCWCKHLVCKKNLKITNDHNVQQAAMIHKIFGAPYRPDNNNVERVSWESWRLVQRFILVVISIFVVNPLYKVTAMFPCIVLFTVIYIKVNPYKERYWVLHWLEISSLLNCFIVIAYSFFHAFYSVFSNAGSTEDVKSLVTALLHMELVLSPIVLSALMLIFTPIHIGLKVLNQRINKMID